METVYYTKRFTSGTLKGLCVISKASFSTVERCYQFAQIGKTGQDIITKAKWVIVDRSFQNYKR